MTAFLDANPAVAGQPVGSKEIPLLFADTGYEVSFYIIAAASAIALVGTLLMKHGRTPATGGTAY
ncbi:hypothetical protein [Nocardia mexicana]|uniref:Uncharacterized protein n=1 Tax=Nocardia mexicana TaxID=279262 RepID=A0A370GLD2_9NOCA|nr:hypothetical protein [Nocardia mexicana]RDI44471.1 hypothetical protein DFR68_11788 [Nocardia mexicana]